MTRAGSNASTNIALWHIQFSLSMKRAGTQLSLSWPAAGTNFVLEAKESLGATNWAEMSQPPAIHSNECVVKDTIVGSQRIYRLRKK